MAFAPIYIWKNHIKPSSARYSPTGCPEQFLACVTHSPGSGTQAADLGQTDFATWSHKRPRSLCLHSSIGLLSTLRGLGMLFLCLECSSSLSTWLASSHHPQLCAHTVSSKKLSMMCPKHPGPASSLLLVSFMFIYAHFFSIGN